MTKAEYIDLIIHGLTGGKLVSSQFRKYHPKVIAGIVDNALGDLFYRLFREDPAQLDLFAKAYDSVSVTYNATYHQLESTLPNPVVQVKGDAGIRWVVSVGRPSEPMVRLSRESANNLHRLLVNRVDDVGSYFLMNGKLVLSGFNLTKSMVSGTDTISDTKYYLVDGTGIVVYNGANYRSGEVIKGTTGFTTWTQTGFVGFLWEIVAPTTLAMGLIVPVSSLDATDQVMIPAGQYEYVMIYVRKYFDNLGFQDLLNDSKSE
jgi:hypothetical protein